MHGFHFADWVAIYISNPVRAKEPTISLKDNPPFAFAGLWERWEIEEQAVESCTIIVTEANEFMRAIHDRMPVILAEEDYDRWLDIGISDPAGLRSLLKPCSSQWLQAYPVSQAVNSSRNEGEALASPLSVPKG